MKGTLFSADFIYDSSDNPRLLEINTDTAFIDIVLEDCIDFSAFKQVLIDTSMTRVHVIYKGMQQNFVDKLKAYIEDECSFITEFATTVEEMDVIYPTSIVDADDQFVLRLAYDENAILDSKYAKTDAITHNLFHSRSESSKVIQGAHSSSYGVYDSLEATFNGDNLPDFVSSSFSTGRP